MRDLKQLNFENTYARLGSPFGVPVEPTPLRGPRPVAWNPDVAKLLGLDPPDPRDAYWVEAFSGAARLPGTKPIAMRYAGHQFGEWVPQLGDGRAILLGEVCAPGGRWDLHLKGAGVTPFSRGFDGRAVLRSTIREYLCSEAMHGLRIPTTRALCIVGSEEPVRRDGIESAATLLRVSPSHVRFGSFQAFGRRGEDEHLRTLFEYVIEQHFPELSGAADRARRFLEEVARRTARTIARWQAVGWTHGVLNTDNMSILGHTIDYGPYGFMDAFDPRYSPNRTDSLGRYSFRQQPAIGLWNLEKLAESLLPVLPQEEARGALEVYEPTFVDAYTELLHRKLGLRERHDEDSALIDRLFELMMLDGVDYPLFWRRLGRFSEAEGSTNEALQELFVDKGGWSTWADSYRQRLRSEGSDPAERRRTMDAENPKYVLRNYLAENAIRSAVDHDDYSEIERLRQLLRDPFAEQPAMQKYAELPPEWGRGLVLSCSS